MKTWRQFGLLLVVVTWAGVGWAAPLPTTEDVVRERVQYFTKALMKDNYEDAIRYIDPDIVKARGKDALKADLKHFMNTVNSLNAAAYRKLTGFRIRRVEFSEDKTTATVDMEYHTGTKNGGAYRQEFPGEQKWVLKNKIWYWVK